MKEYPILFNAEMVRAVLDGRKTVTRRLNRLAEVNENTDEWRLIKGVGVDTKGREIAVFVKKQGFGEIHVPCDFGSAGGKLWVRETWTTVDPIWDGDRPLDIPLTEPLLYRATATAANNTMWRPSIFLPRWASRILLEVVSVRVERVQEISEEQAAAEGTKPIPHSRESLIMGTWSAQHRFRDGFWQLWDSINAKRGYSWQSNPWVWVVEFKRVQP